MTLPVPYVAQAPGLDFSQFGPFAVVLAILATAVGVLWKHQVSAHDRDRKRIEVLEALTAEAIPKATHEWALKRIGELEAALAQRNTEDRESLARAQAELAKAQGRRRSE